jgi:hypothetical protein
MTLFVGSRDKSVTMTLVSKYGTAWTFGKLSVKSIKSAVTQPRELASSELVEMKVPTLDQFTKAARSLPDDERVPYAFEKRVIAHLSGRAIADISGMMASAMWKAARGCLAISLITGAAVGFAGTSPAELFASDLERTVLAPVDVEDSW